MTYEEGYKNGYLDALMVVIEECGKQGNDSLSILVKVIKKHLQLYLENQRNLGK